MGFIEADNESQFTNTTKEEQELTILGMMVLSSDNYKTVKAQLTEDDFVECGDFFRAVCMLYEQGWEVNFNNLAELCEELGIIPKTEPIRDIDNFWKTPPDTGIQKIGSMVMFSCDGYNIQFFIDLLKGKEDLPDVYIDIPLQTEDDQQPAPVPNPIPICKDKNTDKYIYNIQGKASQGEKNEILATNRDSQRDTSVTNRDTSLQSDEVECPLSKKIRDWVECTTAWFTNSQLDSELNVKNAADKTNRRTIIKRLCDRGTLQKHQQCEGKYRYVNTNIEKLNLKQVTPRGVDIRFPFNIEDYVKLYPGNVVVVAGTANAGKTAFMLNVIQMNLDKYANRIRYFSSEGGAEELRSRLDLFPMSDVDLDKFEAVRKTAYFADAIAPEWINIIDFLEMSTDLWVVNDYLTAIQNKLTSGIGIVAIQKKQGALLGRGAEFGLEKPKLYLTMDSGKLTIIKAKDWRDKKANPNGMTAEFKLVNGCKFVTTKPLSAKDAPKYNAQMTLFGEN